MLRNLIGCDRELQDREAEAPLRFASLPSGLLPDDHDLLDFSYKGLESDTRDDDDMFIHFFTGSPLSGACIAWSGRSKTCEIGADVQRCRYVPHTSVLSAWKRQFIVRFLH